MAHSWASDWMGGWTGMNTKLLTNAPKLDQNREIMGRNVVKILKQSISVLCDLLLF